MSAQQNIQMEFIISDSSLNKLAAIMGGGGASGKSGGGGKGVGKLSSVMEKFSIGNVAKLAAIGVGISVGVGLIRQVWKMMVQASPMLQSMLKLFQVGIMFILRPIGDFIGFLLRPMMIYLLRNVFLPWYRTMAPIMRIWGAGLGAGLVSFIKDPFGSLTGWIEGTFVGKIAAIAFPIIGIAYGVGKLIDAIMSLDIDLGEVSAAIGTKVTNLMNSVGSSLQGIWDYALPNFMSSVGGIGSGLISIADSLGLTKIPFVAGLVAGFESITSGLSVSGLSFGDIFNVALTAVTATMSGFVTAWTDIFDGFVAFIADPLESFRVALESLAGIFDFITGGAFGDIGKNLQEGVSSLIGGDVSNSVNVAVSGGMNMAEDAINGLKDLMFGWMEDSNTKRY